MKQIPASDIEKETEISHLSDDFEFDSNIELPALQLARQNAGNAELIPSVNLHEPADHPPDMDLQENVQGQPLAKGNLTVPEVLP